MSHKHIKYIIVGLTTTAIYFLVLYILVDSFALSIIFSSSIAYIISLLFNYLMHYHWTFISDNPHKIAIFRFVIMNIIGFFINLFVMSVGVNYIPDYYLLIQFVAIATIVIWNYILNSLWVYKNNESDEYMIEANHIE